MFVAELVLSDLFILLRTQKTRLNKSLYHYHFEVHLAVSRND